MDTIVTFRAPDELVEEIDAAAAAAGFNSRAQFLRQHLERTVSESESINPNTDDIQALADRITALESAVRPLLEADTEPPEPPREPQPQPEENTSESNRTQTATVGFDGELEAALDGFSPGRTRQERQERRETARELLEWLREQSHPVQKSDVLADLYGRLSLEGQGEKTFWVRLCRPALSHAAGRGFVDDSGRSYEWNR